jgi:putative transposase
MRNQFRYFKTSADVIRLAVMIYIRFPLPLRNVEDQLHERGVDITRETVRFWWNRFGPMIARENKKRRSQQLRQVTQLRWHLDEIFVKINGQTHHLWRAVDRKGEVLESFVTKIRDKALELKFLKQATKHLGRPKTAPRDWVHPGLTAAAIFTREAPTRRAPLFDVEQLYRNLVTDGEMEPR